MDIQMICRIQGFCEQNNIFSEKEGIIIGLSGGADSVFLACAMRQLAAKWDLLLHLVHVNHGIRGREADRDEEFCRGLAEKLGMPITVFHGNIPELAVSRGMTEEEAGRYYRYQCMEGLCGQLHFDKIAVAHHMDDQAETVLFQMLRGSSLRGLGGMSPVRGRIVRPLLAIRRTEIEAELRREGQNWCEDSTNQELVYSRNRLRHQVIPYLEQQVSMGAVQRLARTAEHLRELSDYIKNETAHIYGQLVQEGKGRLEWEAEAFCKLHPVLQRELAMELFEKAAGSRKDITSRHVEGLCRLAAGATGKRLDFPYGMRAGKDYGIVWLQGNQSLPILHFDTLKASVSSGDTERGKQAVSVVHFDTLKTSASVSDAERGNQSVLVLPWTPGETKSREYYLEDSFGKMNRILLKKVLADEISGQNQGKVPKNICTKWFDYARISGMLEFRHPQEGDYFLLNVDGNRKKVNRFLIDCKVSQERRKALWVLAVGAHVLWIPELGRSSAGFYVTEGTREILCASYEPSWEEGR